MSFQEPTAHYPAGFIHVSGPEARPFLENILSNDVPAPATYHDGQTAASYAALLTPQGKILADFLAVATAEGYLLELDGSLVGDITKRLTMYKLRADVKIEDVSGQYVAALAPPTFSTAGPDALCFADPRSEQLGQRAIVSNSIGKDLAVDESALKDYDARRIEFCVPRGGVDFVYGDTYPHEANMDVLNGVSFTKGCFVGQEVVSRMQNKTVVRKRVIRVTAPDTLSSGEVTAGPAPLGHIGTVVGYQGLALLRLDRCIEAVESGTALSSNGIEVYPDETALDRFRSAMQARAANR